MQEERLSPLRQVPEEELALLEMAAVRVVLRVKRPLAEYQQPEWCAIEESVVVGPTAPLPKAALVELVADSLASLVDTAV